MESVEVSAKTVDEAIDIALEDLGLKRSQEDIELLTPAKPGPFGLGGEQARGRVTRKLGSRVLVTVDVEAYHRRREDTLRGLARRMADRVRQSRRPMTLEPMPAAERRIIHIALADDPSVMTASTGFGEGRKVVIRPRGNGGPRHRREGPGRSPGPFEGPRI